MLLTEPDAGSDVGALITRAVKNEDGTYSITGNKIYITWGDHAMTDNVIHLVLARTPEAPLDPPLRIAHSTRCSNALPVVSKSSDRSKAAVACAMASSKPSSPWYMPGFARR